jgi:hypothetical protein
MGDFAAKDMNSPTVGKVEDPQAGDRSSSSLASTPEQEESHEQDLPHNPEQQQQQKRKGGRKPVSHIISHIHFPTGSLPNHHVTFHSTDYSTQDLRDI